MTHKIKLKPILIPNFVIIERPPGKRQDGFFSGEGTPCVPVEDLDEQALFELSQDFIKRLYAKAKKQPPTLTLTNSNK